VAIGSRVAPPLLSGPAVNASHAARRPLTFPSSCLLFLATVASWPSAGAAQINAQYEEGIIEVIAERLPALTLVVLIDSAGSVLLPVEHVTYYLELPTNWSGTTFSVPRLGGSTAALDTAMNTLTVGTTRSELAPAEIARHGPLVYLRAERLAELLDAQLQVEFATLTVAIARATPFPAQQRIIAEQRRAVVRARQRFLERRHGLDAAPYAPLSGGGIVDWQISTNGVDPSRLTTVRLSPGAALLGGDLGAGAVFELGRASSQDVHDVTLRYHRVFPHGRYIRQAGAGDVLTSGLFARFIRGVELSNRPFTRSGELSAIFVQPDLPAGWEYEVFQGNQLLGYSDVASFDPVAIPLRAGTTPVQVRMYGPAGEEVISTLLYQTPVSLLQLNAVEYSVGAGECAASCDEFAHADVRYGANSLFTFGGGVEVFRDTAGSQIRPYFVSSMASGMRATAELTYMPFNLYSANVALFPRDGSRANLRGSMSRPGLGPISLGTGVMRWDLEAVWDERIQRQGSRFSQFRFGGSASGQPGGLERWRLSWMGSFSRGFLETRYDRDNTSARAHLLSGRAAIYVPFTIRAHTLRPLINTAFGVGESGLRLAEAGLSIQPRHNVLINAGVQWNRGNSRPALSIGYNARTRSVHSALRAVSSPSGVASSSFMVGGSTAVAHDGSITSHASARTGYAGLHGIVFIDRDDDGVFSEGDVPVPDAHLIVGAFRTATDDSGRFLVWGMQSYEAVPVAIDSARTPDPSLITSRSDMVVRPTPNMARRLDVPLVQTRELIGALTAAPDVPTVAGISLDIINVDSGALTAAVTFSDGFFYVSRLRPGRYRITISGESLDVIGASATPGAIDFTIPAAGEEPVVELPTIHLQRR
jgi:hypothetical protein